MFSEDLRDHAEKGRIKALGRSRNFLETLSGKLSRGSFYNGDAYSFGLITLSDGQEERRARWGSICLVLRRLGTLFWGSSLFRYPGDG